MRNRRAKPKKPNPPPGKPGKPPKVYTPEQLTIIHKHWPRRHGVKIREAVDTINKAIAPRTVTAGWLYANVK